MHSLWNGLIFLGLSVMVIPEHGQKWILAPLYGLTVSVMAGDIAKCFDIKLQKQQPELRGGKYALGNRHAASLLFFVSGHAIGATGSDTRPVQT
jgi:hypothetical protein